MLIIDDILDEGHTLGAIIDFCRHAGAAAVHTAVLIDKDHQRKARPDLKADYVGLSCIDRYIFGYGMDYKGYWRNAPGIYAVKVCKRLGGAYGHARPQWVRSHVAATIRRPGDSHARFDLGSCGGYVSIGPITLPKVTQRRRAHA